MLFSRSGKLLQPCPPPAQKNPKTKKTCKPTPTSAQLEAHLESENMQYCWSYYGEESFVLQS